MKAQVLFLLLVLAWPLASTAEAQQPDERILWQLLNARKYRLLRQAIADYQRQYPGWKPPQDLVRSLAAKTQQFPVQPDLLGRALRQNDAELLLKLARRQPKLFACPRTDALRALARAYAQRGESEAARKWYVAALRCLRQPRPVLDEALWQLTPQVFSSLLEEARPRISASAYADLAYQNTRRHLFALLEQGAWQTVATEALRKQAKERGDVDLIAAVAWAWQRLGDFARAQVWFESGLELAPADASLAVGMLESLIQLGQDEGVLALGERFLTLRQAAFGHLLSRAWECYRQGDYEQSQILAERIGRWFPQAEEVRYLAGWLAMQRGDYAQAKRVFEALFLAHPEREDYAHALVVSQLKAGEDPDRLVERFPYPVWQAQLAPYRARRSFGFKQFQRAYLLAPQAFPELERLLFPSLSLGGMARFKSGQQGLDRLQLMLAPWYEGIYPHANYQFTLRIGRLELDSDRLRPASIRTLQASRASLSRKLQAVLDQEALQLMRDPPPHALETAWLELAYHQEGRLNPYVQVGLTPLGGPLAPRPTVRLGVFDWVDLGSSRLYLGAEAYRQSVRQSLLSYTGWELSGKRWGQVLRNGLKFSSLLQIGRWSVYQSLDSAFVDGHGTKDNWMISYALAPGYDLYQAGFDYLTLGPFFQFMHYANNQNHFRPGHGGYFSPQAFYAGGIQLSLRTAEGKKFLLEGRLAAGVQHFREAAEPWFPLGCRRASPLCRLEFPENRQTSFTPSGELRFALLLHPHLQLVGGIYALKTQGWQEAGGGLALRFLWAPTQSVLSADLPESLFAALE